MHINELKQLTDWQRGKVSAIMTNFDFVEVCRVMELSRYTWGDETPSLYEVMSSAEEILAQSVLEGLRVETGGFIANFKDDCLSLTFNIEQQEA